MSRFVPFVVSAVLLAACTGGGAVEEPPSAADELAAAAERLAEASSFTFVIARDGEPVDVEAIAGLAVAAIEGTYVAPDRAAGIADARLGPLAASVDYTAVGPDLWFTNPLTGALDRYDAAAVLDIPAVLEALPTIVAEDVAEVVVEPVDGVSVIRGELDTSRLAEVSGGIVGSGVTALRGTLDADGVLASVVFEDPAEIGTSWRFEFADLGIEATIEPPA